MITNIYKEPPTYYCRSTSNYNVDNGCCAMDTAEGENADLSSVHSPQLRAMLCTVAKRNTVAQHFSTLDRDVMF